MQEFWVSDHFLNKVSGWINDEDIKTPYYIENKVFFFLKMRLRGIWTTIMPVHKTFKAQNYVAILKEHETSCCKTSL